MSKHEKDVAKGWNIFHWDWFWKPFNERSIAKWLKSPSVDFSAFVHILGLFLGIALMVLALAILYHLVITTLSFKLADTSKPDEVIRNLLLSLAALIGAPFLVWRTMIASRQTKTSEEKTEIDRQTHYTTLYTKSIELLGAMRVAKDARGNDKSEPAMELRLGAIYALERIARDSWKDHWPIMEVLTAYIRENSPYEEGDKPEPITTDIQAALMVIGRRNKEWVQKEREKSQILNLSRCNFRNAIIENLNLDFTNFSYSYFQLIDCSNSDFNDAKFTYCILLQNFFSFSNFNNTNFSFTSCVETNFKICNFENSEFVLIISKESIRHQSIHSNPQVTLRFYNCDLSYLSLLAAGEMEISFLKSNLYKATLIMGLSEKISFDLSILCSSNLTQIAAIQEPPLTALIKDLNTTIKSAHIDCEYNLDFVANKVLIDEIFSILKSPSDSDDDDTILIEALIKNHP